MTGTEFAELAEKHRSGLVRLTVTRGHDEDEANDIVQNAIVRCLSKVQAFTSTGAAIEELERTMWSLSGNAYNQKRVREKHFTRLNEEHDDDLEGASEEASHDPTEDYRTKMDVKHALMTLSEEEREIARLLFIEEWSYQEAIRVAPEKFTNKTQLCKYVVRVIKPRLRDLLKDYAPKGGT